MRKHASKFIGRGEPGASEIMANLFDPNYLQKNELVFIGSPETVAQKIQSAAKAGVFNVFMGEFNFSDLPQSDLMRSIRLFGEKVIRRSADMSLFENGGHRLFGGRKRLLRLPHLCWLLMFALGH